MKPNKEAGLISKTIPLTHESLETNRADKNVIVDELENS
jgi:hypothetical protein